VNATALVESVGQAYLATRPPRHYAERPPNARPTPWCRRQPVRDRTSCSESPTSPASADTTEPFFVPNPYYEVSFTSGSITWHNRTATITGHVFELDTPGYTTAYFQAFAGSRQIGATQTRTINEVDRRFEFVIGDTNLRGGINLIHIWVCVVPDPDLRFCSRTYFFDKR
jgi:hypothetical protein